MPIYIQTYLGTITLSLHSAQRRSELGIQFAHKRADQDRINKHSIRKTIRDELWPQSHL